MMLNRELENMWKERLVDYINVITHQHLSMAKFSNCFRWRTDQRNVTMRLYHQRYSVLK